jgi:adenylate cyclase
MAPDHSPENLIDGQSMNHAEDDYKGIATLLRIARAVAQAEGLDEQLQVLVAELAVETNAERGTLFLNDPTTNELYSRVAMGEQHREIRIPNTAGVAGESFSTGTGIIIDDAYSDHRFDRTNDERTGFKTRSIACAPVKTVKGKVIGVAQILNKKSGDFDQGDLQLLEAICEQASITLQGTVLHYQMRREREIELDFLQVVSEISSEIHLGPMLQKIMSAITRMLDADRSTLFLNDPRTDELFTQLGQGLESINIRLPNSAGIAGTVFVTGQSVNIPHAYADLRFNPSFDKQTGYFTRSILCVPVQNKEGQRIGVTQVLNKKGGPFTDADEQRLKAFTSQIAIGLENASLFKDVEWMKNYNDSVLQSMSNGVVTFNAQNKIVTCNAAALRILQSSKEQTLGQTAEEFFQEANAWVVDALERAKTSGESVNLMDARLAIADETVSIHMTALPLTPAAEHGSEEMALGSMLLIEDVTNEKRMKSTMSRYMDPGLAEQLLGKDGEALGGKSSVATVLFSDIRGFTTLTEELGAQGTVSLLNEYFTLMVDCITDEGGMLDKFIGDAIMAIFGTPFPTENDEDAAVRASIAMMRSLATYNRERAERGAKPVNIGVGLNTDMIVSGNIGSQKRMDYTVIGDGVNLAARIEGACKQYGAQVLLSEYTVARLKGTYRIREIDRVIVKGKTEPVAIHELLEHHTEESFPNMIDATGRFRDGLSLYRAREWDRARETFRTALDLNPNDKCASLYIERCDLLSQHGVDDDWNGVWVMETK